MPPPPLRWGCLGATVPVSIRPTMRSWVHSWRCTLNYQSDSCQHDLFDYGSFLRRIAARTYHRTIYSLDGVHSHSFISFAGNAFIARGTIDFRRGSQSPFTNYHFSCMCQWSWDCTGPRYSFDWLGCSGPQRGHDPESTADLKSHYCICCHCHVCNCREANRVTITISAYFGFEDYY